MTCDLIVNWLSWIADLMLATAALYVTGQALRGRYREAEADKLEDGPDKRKAIADAKTFYAMASLTEAWVLLLIFGGTLLKVLVGFYRSPWWS